MDRKDLEGVWTVLSTDPPLSGLSAAPIGYAVKAGSLLAGIDSQGRRHLLIPLLPGEPARSNLKGSSVHVGRLSHEETQYLTIFCLKQELHQVFAQFCWELAAAAEIASSPAKEASEAFERWKDLFSDAAPSATLSEESLIGLLGELLTLEELLKAGSSKELDYWVGPNYDVHDFRTPSHAIEVKSTLVREGRVVPISSIDQLQEPLGAALHLQHFRLQRDPSGIDLPQLVNQVLECGAGVGAFRRKLSLLGVNVDDLTVYKGRRYKVIERVTYDVSGERFPRITRSSFLGGNLPAGTLHLKYSVDLTNEPPHPLPSQQVSAVISSFANEASDEVDS